ncbi:MAG: RNA methyltransferase [Alteromonadaceae bacterium]|nr:MAG: RNA methyltransferase [Alteromonadaceae bacterium]
MKFVLLLFNIAKGKNIGQLIRTANALGAEEICIIGKKKFSTYGNQNTQQATPFRHFYKVEEAALHYHEQGYDIVGVEITENSFDVNTHDFVKNTVFILGNEWDGIKPSILELCDYCVFIPQFGVGASLNVTVAAGIVLNGFMKGCTTSNKIDKYKFLPRTEHDNT